MVLYKTENNIIVGHRMMAENNKIKILIDVFSKNDVADFISYAFSKAYNIMNAKMDVEKMMN